ncbi:MAG: hypothetical protein ACYDBB_16045 [Armatimonadota bacterium]
MKIVAQSLVPTNPLPYLHMGYLSATTADQHHAMKGMMPFFAMVALLIIAYLRIRKAPIWCIVVTIICLGGVLAAMTTPWDSQPGSYLHPYKVTNMRLAALSLMAMESLLKGESISTDTNELPKTWKFEHKQNEDGWFHAFRIAKGKKVGELYIISSAGPDGRFGTLDDITRPVTRADVQELKRHVKETAR